MGKRILVVEDDKSISMILCTNLKLAGFTTDQAFDGETGLDKGMHGDFDLIMLDLMLPLRDGFSICKTLRANSINTPIIMVTAKEDEVDKVMGLDLGADDYITKPFSIVEVLARVKANMRRAQGEKVQLESKPKEGRVVNKELVIDTNSYIVTKRDIELELSSKEFEVLLYLAENPGKVFSREDLLKKVWGYDGYYGDMRTVDVTMARLRSKIEDDTQDPIYIKTIRGRGYYMPE